MQSVRNIVLSYMRVDVSVKASSVTTYAHGRMYGHTQLLRMCSMVASADHEEVVDRVMKLVKKFDKINADKVTETADFQKDLSLDSLDQVELVMAFEEEFSVEIPDAEADKLKCCADVAKYIVSSSCEKISESS